MRRYLDYLARDRGARIAFLVFAFSWLGFAVLERLFVLLEIFFPAVAESSVVERLGSAVSGVVETVAGILSWYPRLKSALGMPNYS